MSERWTEEFTAWAQEAARPLLRVAVALTGDRHSAEDLLQDVLARVYLAWPRVEDPDAYARRALVNAATSRWRRLGRRPEVPLAEHAAVVDPARGLGLVEDRSLVVQALQRLPARQRAVLVLRYLEDCTERQAADALGVSVGTIKSQSARALARLRESAVLAGAGDYAGVEEA
jgi:RNA polymerase sigma-70 factor (sigma-E family)